jgi:sulfur relay (sulfurtransferase) DsrF/TusC family protein
MKVKNFLFLHSRAPAAAGPEAFDLVLTAAAFDQEVTLLLIDDGVHWLSRGLPELVTQSVETIAVERESLAERGIPAPEHIRLEERSAIPALIAGAEIVVQG